MYGKYLKELRKSKGWSQQKLAEAAKVSYSVICKIEQNTALEFTIETAIKLADALGISIDELVGRGKSKK